MSDRSVPRRAIEVDAALTHALTWHGRPREALELPIALASRSRDGSRLHAFRLVAAAFAGEIQSLEERTKSFLANTRQDRVARCATLGALAWAQMFSGECLAAVETGTAAVALGRRLDPRGRQQAQPWFFSALTLIFTDQLDRAATIIDEGRRAAESTGTSWPLPLYHSELANIHWLRGSWDDAVAEDEAAQAIADEYDLQVGVLTGALSRLARILVHRGETDEARKLLEKSDGGSRQTGSALLAGARALVHEATGNLAAAEQTLASAWDENIRSGVRAEIRLLAPDLVRLHLANGHRGDARPIVSEAYRMAERMSVASAEGAALRCAGLLDDSPDLLLRASAAYGRSPRVFDHALALEETALSLARSRQHAEALELARRADATYKQLGAYYDRLRLNGALRAIGLPPTAKRLRARTTRGWESLTDSELRVVKLVAGGATNKEVAGSLLISRHTVDSHLRHAYAKLDVASRVQLAVVAMRQSQRR
ncbi:MAG: helix-turn-helix transcriptional regulator [Chloroflexota bacterium]